MHRRLNLLHLVKGSKRVAIATGGTSGHISPALASAHGYRHRSLAEVLFFTTTTEEADMIERHGYPCIVIHGSPVARQKLRRKILAVANVGIGCMQAFGVFRSFKPDIVIGFGSYATAGPILAARMMGIKTAIHESNIMPGLANKVLGPYVDRIYLGFKDAAGHFPRGKTLVTGNPVRPELAYAELSAKEAPDGIRPARVLITGGSSGSHFLNVEVPPLLNALVARGVSIEVMHQSGAGEDELVRRLYDEIGMNASVTPYIEDMLAAYRWADFAITCAGAATLAELATIGLPALMIPLQCAAAQHQIHNAIAFAQHSGWWLTEENWNRDAIAEKLAAILTHPSLWTQMSLGAKECAGSDAAQIMAADFELLTGMKRRHEMPAPVRSS
jgi:UDP-N-acetylglucosamine--N-acetylmuramyl-(pentapeptide) pyrophosphoryl-undecaprenol N-acetylglucosamine transferase